MIKAGGIGLSVGLAVALWAYTHGIEVAEGRHAAERVRMQAEVFRAGEIASRRETARLEAEAQAVSLARELEDLANADPVTDGCGLPAGRVLRLNRGG